MTQFSVFFEGGLVIEAESHEMTDDALIFYDELGQETMKIPRAAIYTYTILED